MLPSGLPEIVGDDEDLARFLTQRSQFSVGKRRAKPAAFLPNPTDRETSVMRHGREPLEALWELGMVAAGSRTLHGAALVRARAVRSAGLDVVADEPPPRHAVIRGWTWSEGDPDLRRAQHLEVALQLAKEAADLILR